MPLICKKKGQKIEPVNINLIRHYCNFEYIWDVENFPSLARGTPVLSPSFHGDPERKDKWKLELEVMGDANSGLIEPNVQLSLLLSRSKSFEPVKAEYQFSFLNADNKVIHAVPIDKENFYEQDAFHTPQLMVKTKFLIGNSTLRIHCQVSSEKPLSLKRKRDEDKNNNIGNESSSFSSKQLKKFFTNGDFTDVVLKTEENSIRASKLVLAAHSPVFQVMFQSGMLESQEHTVKIEDFTEEIVRGFLEFIYTGETSLLNTNPTDLLKISEKYQVSVLKEKAEGILLKQLKVKNAAELLVLANFYSETNLKPKVIEFVNRHTKEVQQTSGFQKMSKNFPNLVLDLYAAVPE